MTYIYIVIGSVVVIIAIIATSKSLRKPTASGIGPGGILNPPVDKSGSLPPGASVSIDPDSLPNAVRKAVSTNFSVTVHTASGSTAPHIPIEVRITEGNDGGVSSLIEIDDPQTGDTQVGSGLNSATDGYGVLRFRLKATADGDDRMTITVDPGARERVEVYDYETSNT